MIRVYLDVCCLNRPFDDQTQTRVHLEAVAVLSVLKRMEQGELLGISSTVVQVEINNNRDSERQARLRELASTAQRFVIVEEQQTRRAAELQALGFHFFDALHLACAESAGADIFLTTDDRLLRLALRLGEKLTIKVANPAQWLMEIIDTNGRDDN